ncbi:hypothetical protein CB1_000237015 [Camelus ferus]|nr:hypothetical protein CB1_000237015 [Camelus ferus]
MAFGNAVLSTARCGIPLGRVHLTLRKRKAKFARPLIRRVAEGVYRGLPGSPLASLTGPAAEPSLSVPNEDDDDHDVGLFLRPRYNVSKAPTSLAMSCSGRDHPLKSSPFREQPSTDGVQNAEGRTPHHLSLRLRPELPLTGTFRGPGPQLPRGPQHSVFPGG